LTSPSICSGNSEIGFDTTGEDAIHPPSLPIIR